METSAHICDKKQRKKFKSYYVVWKQPTQQSFILCFQCLNRTMQYGNVFFIIISWRAIQFKSYYVVWKLFCKSTLSSFFFGLNRTMQYGNFLLEFYRRSFADEFKSYYVVWKHKRYHSYRYARYRFKSYYVVWKLSGVSHIFFHHRSLNRTMQYGNFIIIFFIITFFFV